MQMISTFSLRLAFGVFLATAFLPEAAFTGGQRLRKPDIKGPALELGQNSVGHVERSHHQILPGVELPGAKRKRRVMDAINKFRAEICANMHDEHGKRFESFEACEKFMEEACKPGKDKSMDGDRKEVTSEEGFCREYFPATKEKAEKEVDELEAKEAAEAEKGAKYEIAAGPSPGPAPGPADAAPAPAPKKKAAAPAPAPGDEASSPGPAPAPGPMGSPAAPVPAPFIPGLSAGKPWGPIPGDEAYYYKNGGKDASRLHMSEGSKLPTQGYWGKLVEHDDGKTSTGDWGREFGPRSGHQSIDSVCDEHPDNEWCYRQGFGSGRRSKSSSYQRSGHFLLAMFVISALRAL